MKKLALIAASIATAAFGFSATANAECGEVTVGEANWSTAQILAQIERFQSFEAEQRHDERTRSTLLQRFC